MSWSRMSRIGWGWLIVAGLGAAPTRAGSEAPAAAHWVAPDAVIYLEIARPGDLIDRLNGDRFQAILNAAPGFAEAMEQDEVKKLGLIADAIVEKLGTSRKDAVRALTGGGVILAVEGERAERAVLIVTPADSAFLSRARAQLLEMARQDAAANGLPDPIHPVDHRGVAMYLGKPQEAHAIVEDHLVLANGVDALRAVIDRAKDQGKSIVDDAGWKARRERVDASATAWGHARLDRLRQIDPKKYGNKGATVSAGQQLLLGPWIDALRKAPWAEATLTWQEGQLAADLVVPKPADGYPKALQTYLPPEGAGAPAPVMPPRTIASLGLWRDLAALWEVRAELFKSEDVQNLEKLDGVARQFLGGHDLGTGILRNLGPDWRLVIARQDEAELDPTPDVKLPAFALVIGLKPGDEEFPTLLKVAFQTFVGLANLGTPQSKAPLLDLGSETVEGITISTARFLRPKGGWPKGPVHPRHNLSPALAHAENHLILSSSVGLARDLVHACKGKALDQKAGAVLVARVDHAELANLLDGDRAALVAKNMREKGNHKAKAEAEVNFLLTLLRTLGQASYTLHDTDDSIRLHQENALGGK